MASRLLEFTTGNTVLHLVKSKGQQTNVQRQRVYLLFQTMTRCPSWSQSRRKKNKTRMGHNKREKNKMRICQNRRKTNTTRRRQNEETSSKNILQFWRQKPKLHGSFIFPRPLHV